MKDKVYAAFEESYKQIIAELAAKRTSIAEKKYEPTVNYRTTKDRSASEP